MKLTRSKARRTLTFFWLLFFFVNTALVLLLWFRGEIGEDNLWKGLKVINCVYAPYISIVTLHYWTGLRSRRKTSAQATTAFVVALSVTSFWNLLLVVPIALVTVGYGDLTIDGALDFIEGPLVTFSWLVGGSIGAYFGRDA